MLVQNFQSSVATTHTHTHTQSKTGCVWFDKKIFSNPKENKLFSSFGYIPKNTLENIFQYLVAFSKSLWKTYNLLLSHTFSSPKHIYEINK